MRNAKTLLVLLMLVLVPLRAFAAITVGDCVVAQHGAAGESADSGPHDEGAPPHSHGDAQHDHEHCASASFVAPAMLLALSAQAAANRVAQREHFAAGFVPDQLDPPPLAS
jgi:hypothetical protein